LKTFIVEDDISFALEVEMLLRVLDYPVLGTANSSDKGLVKIMKERPDVILVDIYIEGTNNGIEFAKKIRHLNIPVIFMTAYNDEKLYELAKELNPIAFLVKPFNLISLKSILERVKYQLQREKELQNNISDNEFIFIKNSKTIDKVFVKDIYYIKSEGNYCYIFTEDKKYVLKISLVKMHEKLSQPIFIRVHRGHVVNKKKIQNVTKNLSALNLGDFEIPIGGKYKNVVKELISQKDQ